MKNLIIRATKTLISIMFLFIIFRNIELEKTLILLYTWNGLFALTTATILILAQYILAGAKLTYLAKSIPINIGFNDSIKSHLVGTFFTQFGLNFSTGDLARGYYLLKKYNHLGDITLVILSDRITGFIALTVLYTMALMKLRNIVAADVLLPLYWLAMFCFTLVFGYFFLLLSPFKLKFNFLIPLYKFISRSRKILSTKNNIVPVILISFIVVLMNVFVVAFISQSFGLSLSLINYFMVTIPVILISMMPISIAGWGIRESTFITGFALLGIQDELGLSISLVFGLASLLASLPGIFLIEDLFKKTHSIKSVKCYPNTLECPDKEF